MIRVVRAPEPPALRRSREARLTAAREAVEGGGDVVFAGYDVVKDDLAAMQHNKCCYCEKREEQPKFRDVEHYRPKSIYWWLAWTWENLLFACVDCNREYKRDQFPLGDEAARLVAENAPPGAERPLVLDPSAPGVDPTLHIEFRPERVQGRERWVPRGLTPQGTRTIAICGLDRPNLLDLYAEHVIHAVRPKLDGVFAADKRRDQRAVVDAWGRAKRGLLAPMRPFRALSYDALRALVHADTRDRYRLTLERPVP